MSFRATGKIIGDNRVEIEHESLIQYLDLMANDNVVIPSFPEGSTVDIIFATVVCDTIDGWEYNGIGVVDSIELQNHFVP